MKQDESLQPKRWIYPEDMQELSWGWCAVYRLPISAPLSLPLSPGSAEHKQPSPGDLRMRLDRVGLGSAGRAFC